MKWVILLAAFTVSACSTTISQRMALPSEHRASLAVAKIEATANVIGVMTDISVKLEKAVAAELAKRPQGNKLISLKLDIRDMRVASTASRFFAGAFAGGNRMLVSVKVFDVASNALVADYDVRRESNPGGYGAFYDQEEATIREAAEGIVKTLYGET
ncbi:hypothetical protein [Magnetospirillum sp. SS-4]|uniref:hypothetical protein n=1 Tax=Magnetospirillum sp. SS-4 TaxID=2681465 RepID=UPI0013803E29|nr:hypothetical protein [Magnetospirillum sp. SS-4]CAA7617825.1 exported hypothetical protein [Magnetospirillum sp. SS-4]